MAKKIQKAFLFDQNFCIGCKACEVACQSYHHQEPEIRWRKVTDFTIKTSKGEIKDRYLTASCNHCQNPACLEVCPTHAYTKRDDGIVELDRDACIGCGKCAEACIYDAITLYGSNHKAQKCNMCAEKQDAGDVPACVRACPMDVLQIVDLEVADKAGMVKNVVGFKNTSLFPSTRFYPKFKSGVKEDIIDDALL